MTEEELDRLQALADAATPGNWQASSAIAGMVTHEQYGWIAHSPRGSYKETEQLARQDAAFIAAARQAVPELIAEVRRLRQQITGHCDRLAAQSELLSKRAEK